MKSFFIFLFSSLVSFGAFSQKTKSELNKPDPGKKIQIVDAACGECQLKLTGKSCDLAVRINGKSYFVDGTSIDDHGNAHAKTGFCNAIRKAEVQGEVIDNRFKATYFKLVALPGDKEAKTNDK